MSAPRPSASARCLAAARALAPYGAAAARMGAALAGTVGRASWRHRRGLVAVLSRVMWWGALWELVHGGVQLLGWHVESVDATLWTPFAVGLGLCALVAVVAPARHLRWLAIVLGTAHGALGLLTWATLFS